MKYKTGLVAATLVLICSGCSDNLEKAEARYNTAEQLYNQQAFSSAKIELDSIQILYPKAFDVIRSGKQLMRKIELKENERTLAFTDSMLTVRLAEVEPLKKGFMLEKDTVYREIGNYVPRKQKLENNVERTYLRSQVDEDGVMQLISVYFGKSPIGHDAIRVELKDGTFAVTEKIAYDGGNNYRFTDNGNTSEVVTYKGGKDNGVVAFISNYKGERIKVTLQGKRPYVFYLDDQTKKALADTYNLAAVLSDITHLKKNKVLTEKAIEGLKTRIAKREKTDDPLQQK